MPLSLEFCHLYKQIFKSKARYIHLWGGRGRGGSYTATQYFLHLVTQPEYFRGYFMREIATDIRESLWRDFKDRVEDADLSESIAINDSLMMATHYHNVILSKGFKKSSKSQTAKLKSLAGATHVIIEEAEEIGEEDFNQLDDSLRTIKGDIQIIMIFNPPAKNHWIWKKWYNLIDSDQQGYFMATPKHTAKNLLSIFSTYPDNIQNLNRSFIDNLETYHGDYYYTMVKGLISEGARGRVYKDWTPITEMPNLYEKFYGLDFGWNAPVAVIECERHNQNLWLNEMVYDVGLTNKALSDRMEDMGIEKWMPMYADSAEPKDIQDLQGMGWNVTGAKKGPGSVVAGIRFIQKFSVFYTEKSRNLAYEHENYKWRVDQNKMPVDEPEDKNNHLMDSLNYATDHIRVESVSPTMSVI